MNKKDLEETLKEKVTPLLEEIMEKQWGITIPQLEEDITDQLKKTSFHFYLPSHLPFKAAKKRFKAEFLRTELRLHQGNISQLAKSLDVDRRSIHRAILNLDLDIKALRHKDISEQKYQEEVIDKKLRTVLDHYKEIIQPGKMEKMYEEIPRLSRNIAKVLPHQHFKWKEAEREFERQFLSHALEEHHGNISKTARAISLRFETLHRKVKKLGLR